MSVLVHAQGIKTVRGGVNKWQNSVHVVVEYPHNSQHTFCHCVSLAQDFLLIN